MIWVGIDPGCKGAISFIDDNRKVLSSTELVYENGLSASKFFNLFEEIMMMNTGCSLKRTNLGSAIPFFIILESPIAMPKQNIKGLRTSFTNYGKMLAILDLFSIPYQEIPPSKWKREYSLFKKDKEASVEMASKLFPSIHFYTQRGRMMDGKAESLLLADYALRKYK